MGFASLGSGSRGNGTLVAIGGALFLVDCGFNLKQTERRLARLQVSAGDITAILVSHEHSDHIAGVAALAHRYCLPVHASHGTLSRAPEGFNCQAFDGDVPFEIAGVTINPVCVPHDAREPTQFTLSHGDEKIGCAVRPWGGDRTRAERVQQLHVFVIRGESRSRHVDAGQLSAGIKTTGCGGLRTPFQ